MNSQVALLVYGVGVIGLFLLDREWKARTSPALWVPVVWVCIGGSRMVSQWLNPSTAGADVDQYMEGSPLDRAILTGLFIIAVIVLIGRIPKVLTLLKTNWPIVLFFVYCGVSVSWSEYPDVAFKRWTKSLADLAIVLIILTERNRIAALKRFLAWAGFLLLPSSIVLIKYYPDLGRVYDRWSGSMALTGVANDKNMLGLVCFVFGLGAVWRITLALRDGARKSAGPLTAQTFLLATALWLLYKTNSMTSISCFAFGSGMIIVASYASLARKKALIHIMVLGTLAVSMSALFPNLGAGLLRTMGRNPTLTGRTELWQNILAMDTSPMLGTGFASFWLGPRLQKLWAIYWWHPNESHNGYLETYLNLGWMGVLLLGILIVAGYRHVITMLRREPEVGKLCLAYFVSALAYNLTEAGFKSMNLVWIVFLMAISMPLMAARRKTAATRIRTEGEVTVRSTLREEVV